MYKEREYSLLKPIFSTEAATLSPPVFKQTPTLDTQKTHPKDCSDKKIKSAYVRLFNEVTK